MHPGAAIDMRWIFIGQQEDTNGHWSFSFAAHPSAAAACLPVIAGGHLSHRLRCRMEPVHHVQISQRIIHLQAQDLVVIFMSGYTPQTCKKLSLTYYPHSDT